MRGGNSMNKLKKIFLCATVSIFASIPAMADSDISFTLKSDLDMGIAYLQEGKLKEAGIYLKKVNEAKSDYHLAKLYLAFYYLKTGDNTQSINILNEIINSSEVLITSDDINIYLEACLTLSNAYLTTNSTDKAISILEEAIKKSKNDLRWLEKFNFNLGEIYYNNGETDKARKYWQNAIDTGYSTTIAGSKFHSTDKEAARLRFLEGQRYLKVDDYKSTIEVLREAVMLDSSEIIYSRLLEKATDLANRKKLYADIVKRIDKAKRYLINGEEYKAFLEYRAIRGSDLAFDPTLWKSINYIGKKLAQKGYSIDIMY